jgi:hypothetical protein
VDDHPLYSLPSTSMFRRRKARTLRASSWDRTGANNDFVRIEPGETKELMAHDGPGCITHLYAAMALEDLRDHRNAILRCYWDGSDSPSVEVPLGDFFCLAHGRVREFTSLMVTVNHGFGLSNGLNAYFPMPFNAARITVENRGGIVLGFPLGALWYHFEYETYDAPVPDDVHRFHACYRQERPTTAIGDTSNVTLHTAPNLDGRENYVALDTEGEGRMVGLHLEIENVQGQRWYGEGDDMVFIDGAEWPPALHGTGTEEIFGGGACPSTEYAGPYTGFHLIESESYDGLVGMYRWFVHDPIHFSRSIRWTLEHGHANNFANNYSSVAYWYQTPLATLPPLPDAPDMLPPLDESYDEARAAMLRAAAENIDPTDPSAFIRAVRPAAPMMR